MPSLESVTTATLAKALDAAMLRQQAIASNLANAGSADYVPLRVAFEAQLAQARDNLQARGSASSADIAALQPELETDANAAGLQPDLQLADMARNALHYQALIQGLARHLELLSAAVAEGRK